ncbi:hypothetical protein PIB30_063675, partial [Stylosanthes scabra]|nr:hypothetical protein [Stylosanthes scabra]
MEMAVFDIALYFKGYFGYENGHMKYFGQKLIIEEQESDFWSVYEAEEQLKRLGVAPDDIAALWYKDPEDEVIETRLQTFENDRDALEM